MHRDETGNERIGGIEAGMLVAYADGMLPPEQARQVEAALCDNAEAHEALSLMRRSATAARHAFDSPLNQPVPEQLRAVLDRPVGARRALAQRLLPLAASIAALIVGLGAGYLLGQPGDNGATMRLAAGPDGTASSAFDATLLQALSTDETTLNYTDTALATTGAIILLATIETSFGTSCREFRHIVQERQSSATTQNGLACRRADGGWEVTILASSSS